MRLLVTVVFFTTLAGGVWRLAQLSEIARDGFWDFSRKANTEGHYDSEGRPKFQDPDCQRVDGACLEVRALAQCGGPLLAVQSVWLMLVWRGWHSLSAPAQGALRGSVRGALCLPLAVLGACALAAERSELRQKYEGDLASLWTLVLGTAIVGAIAGAAVGGLWKKLRPKSSQHVP